MKISPVNFNTFNCKKPKNNVKFGTMTPEAKEFIINRTPNYARETMGECIRDAEAFPKDLAHFYTQNGHLYCDTKVSGEKRGWALEDERLREMENRFDAVVDSFVELQDELAGKAKPVPQYVGTPQTGRRESVWIGDILTGGALYDINVPWND